MCHDIDQFRRYPGIGLSYQASFNQRILSKRAGWFAGSAARSDIYWSRGDDVWL